ncbi:MAG TPA: hypothetical protein VD866_01945 [Urbifossiella sp.]|nr:hypothetical protein [Urbifossiella sp.]
MTDRRIRINWTIPAPVIIAIVAQSAVMAFAIGIWKASVEGTLAVLESRIAAVERIATSNGQLSERVKGVEVNIETLKEQSVRIEGKLDKAIEQGGRR